MPTILGPWPRILLAALLASILGAVIIYLLFPILGPIIAANVCPHPTIPSDDGIFQGTFLIINYFFVCLFAVGVVILPIYILLSMLLSIPVFRIINFRPKLWQYFVTALISAPACILFLWIIYKITS